MVEANDDEAVWVTVEPSDPSIASRPKWELSACFWKGEVYVPAAIGGNETSVVLCAMHDGVSLVQNWKHAFVPASWAKREYPKEADVVELIERRVRQHLG